MELKNLYYLESLYRLRSFTKAAEEHFVSQPSISNAIKKLEQEVGAELINRTEKPLSFTAEGERFMLHVYNITGAVEIALEDMKRSQKSTTQILTLAWASTFGDVIKPKLFKEFHALYPDIELSLREETSSNILQYIQEGSLDLAYALIPEIYNPDYIQVIPIQICEMYVCMSCQHPMAAMNNISLVDLKEEPIYTFPKGSYIREKIEQCFEKLGIIPHFHSITVVQILAQLVSENSCLTILPLDQVNSLSKQSEIVAIPLKEPISIMKGFILKRGSRKTDAMNKLIEYVEEEVHIQRVY